MSKWSKQGTSYFHRQIDEFMFKHLQAIFEKQLMNVNDIFNRSSSSSSSSLIIYLSFSTDGSRLGASVSSFHSSLLVSVIMDLSVWKKEGQTLVKRPLPLLICNDSETVDMVFWMGTKICEAIKIFHESENWLFSETKGFCRIFSNNSFPKNFGNFDMNEIKKSRYIPVEFKVFLLNGDSKVQQIFCGANSGKSDYRCYCCYQGSHDWETVEGSFSLGLPQRTISSSFTSFKENLNSGNDLLMRITPRISAVLPTSLKGLEDVQKFISEHKIWSFWVTIDPLHVISGHSKKLMDFLTSHISKEKSRDLNQLLRKHCNIGFESKKHPGWKWRLIWASFPVTWSTICKQDDEKDPVWFLVYSWTKVCQLFYKPASSRSCANWIKFVVWCLKHICCWRKFQSSPSLYLHLLWPHCIEQCWWIGFSETMTESHEKSWVLLKTLWKNCASTKHSTKLLFERWAGYVDEHTSHFKKRLSWVSKKISSWWKGFQHPSKVSVELNTLEAANLHIYLVKKTIPSTIYSFKDDGEVSFDLNQLVKADLPILPCLEVTWNFLKNHNLGIWKEEKEKFMEDESDDFSLSTLIQELNENQEPIIDCDGEEEGENGEIKLKRESDSFLDENPFLISPMKDQNNLTEKERIDLSPSTDSSSETKYFTDDDDDELLSHDQMDQIIDLQSLYYSKNNEYEIVGAEMILNCEYQLLPKEKSILLKIFQSQDNEYLITNDYDTVTFESFQRLFGDIYLNEALINWYLGNLADSCVESPILLLTSFWALTDNYSPKFVWKAIESKKTIDLILGPCNFSSSHWGIIGYNKITEKGFWSESMASYFLTSEQRKKFKNILLHFKLLEPTQNIKFERLDMPRQPDGWSCGVSALKTASLLCENKNVDWENDCKSVTDFKIDYIRLIIQQLKL